MFVNFMELWKQIIVKCYETGKLGIKTPKKYQLKTRKDLYSLINKLTINSVKITVGLSHIGGSIIP